ncbi:hypothetical protein [Novilysobacter erysipheiresistens]|uniref:Uncharacterized protein n=1 Tax=Novilysobacter erysipheiresistens TaxID=1749332 RepID=A0ABU7YU91_9GAMM
MIEAEVAYESGDTATRNDALSWPTLRIWQAVVAYRAMLAAAPPPPAEQASGEIPDAETFRLHMGELTTEEVLIAQAAYHLALSQRPVVDEAMVERAAKAIFEDQCPEDMWNAPMQDDERESWRECARVTMSAALAPQQPEKGEG